MQTETTQQVLNGVNVDNLFGTIDAISETTSLGKFTFRASNRWINGGLNQSAIQDYYGAGQEHATREEPFVLRNDEPPVLLGGDSAPNPVEYVLHALAGCLTTALVYHAAARGIQIDEVESRLEGDLDVRGILGMTKQVRNGFNQIRVQFRIKADVPDEMLDEIVRMGPAFSPVFDIVSNPVPVSVERVP